MATQSPFPFLDGLLGRVGEKLKAPEWFVDEAQHRLVLFLNHVLQQEEAARERLTRHAGKVVLAEWRQFQVRLVATPAGLLDLAMPGATPDLTLTITDTSPATLAQAALRGDKPAIRIEGDVQLAGDVNWLVENVRWDVEDDLARVVGDGPAHAVSGVARRVAQALRDFVGERRAEQAGAKSPE